MKKVCMIISILAVATGTSFAGKIATNFAEVKIDNLHIGRKHSMQERFNLPFNIMNLSDEAVRVRLWIHVPTEEELKPGYEPIPNPEWVSLEMSSMTIEAKKTGFSDVYIEIPKNKRYLDKKYQVGIVAETIDAVGEGMIQFGLSLKGRLLITTVDKIIDKTEEEKAQELNFLLRPWELIIPDLPLGKYYSIYEEMGISFTLDYPHKKKALFVIDSLTAEEAGVELPKGFEDAPDSRFLTFNRKKIRFKKKGKEDVRASIKFPDNKKYAGKQYMYVIRASLVNEKTGKHLYSVYSRIYVNTKVK